MLLQYELAFLRNIDFYPSAPREGWESMRSLCLGTKSRNLGDALILSGLPAKLKARYPQLRITTYPRAFNPWVFLNNPQVEGVSRLPGALYGDDSNEGRGQVIQLKERYFGLPVAPEPRPELHLSAAERSWATRMLQEKLLPSNDGKPLIVLHPWGHTRNRTAEVEFWDRLTERWAGKFRFWQVGIEGHGAVKHCEYYLLLPRSFRSCRKLFALLSMADSFVGVDSGPMHAARAFNLPSLILLNHADPRVVFEHRARADWRELDNWRYASLYAENTHVDLARDPGDAAWKQIDAWFAGR